MKITDPNSTDRSFLHMPNFRSNSICATQLISPRRLIVLLAVIIRERQIIPPPIVAGTVDDGFARTTTRRSCPRRREQWQRLLWRTDTSPECIIYHRAVTVIAIQPRALRKQNFPRGKRTDIPLRDLYRTIPSWLSSRK